MAYYTAYCNFEIELNKYIATIEDLHYRDKMVYMLANGKRLRPILGIANIAGNQPSTIQIFNLIMVEIIHNISLVIDDLPEMDNDATRRGRPTFHIQFGLTPTYIFLYQTISTILEHISAQTSPHNFTNTNSLDHQSALYDELQMLLKGQYYDVALQRRRFTLDNIAVSGQYESACAVLQRINGNQGDMPAVDNFTKYCVLIMEKTGSLFTLAVLINNIDYSRTDRNIRDWCYIFSVLFQLSDDVADYTADIAGNKPNIIPYLNNGGNAKQFGCAVAEYLIMMVPALGCALNYELIYEIINKIVGIL